jgi:mono/diheme cytochrome c family protein
MGCAKKIGLIHLIDLLDNFNGINTPMKKWTLLTATAMAALAFGTISTTDDNDLVPIPPSTQRTGGDPQKGYEYLVTGDYVKGGVPYNIALMGMDRNQLNYLSRTGKNASLTHDFTAITLTNGEVLVAPNCLQCHAQVFDNKLVIGLGNTHADFTENGRQDVKSLQLLERMLKLTVPDKYQSSKPFLDVAIAVAPYLQTQVRGVNPADRLAAVLAAHRDPVTFKWNGNAQADLPTEVIPTDTPPWWLLKKKNAMFYNGFGRGDFGRFLMASNLLTVNDTSESREVDSHMPDLLAYIYSLEPPKYPKEIDASLAKEGEKVFVQNCSKCHGSYGAEETYPNLLVPASIIQTDSLLYSSNYSSPQFMNWFNQSWFTTGDHPARLEPFRGYIAPPLDGIWITAPYLHNGSVPTLEALLNSKLRPRYWSRNFDKPEYDYDKPGWKYKKEQAAGKLIYNTDFPGYGNYGHTFGDELSNKERKALIEYLKTL